jgi:predicted RNA-binding protein YlxR (DUF448 family)
MTQDIAKKQLETLKIDVNTKYSVNEAELWSSYELDKINLLHIDEQMEIEENAMARVDWTTIFDEHPVQRMSTRGEYISFYTKTLTQEQRKNAKERRDEAHAQPWPAFILHVIQCLSERDTQKSIKAVMDYWNTVGEPEVSVIPRSRVDGSPFASTIATYSLHAQI